MEILIGLIGLLMMAAGFLETFANQAMGGGIVGAVLFSGGVIALGLAAAIGHLRRIRYHEIKDILVALRERRDVR